MEWKREAGSGKRRVYPGPCNQRAMHAPGIKGGPLQGGKYNNKAHREADEAFALGQVSGVGGCVQRLGAYQ